jgi:membrane protein DedA with SNARE-associated domain
MLVESACIPVPSEVTMLFGGALASGAVAGAHLNIVAVILVGAAGNVVGSYVAWALGRALGPLTFTSGSGRLHVRTKDVETAERWFARHGSAAVFFGRLIPVVQTFISLPAGFASMPALKFGLYTVAGCLPWTAVLGAVGYALGSNWSSVANGFHYPTYVVAALMVIAIVVAVIVHRRRRPQSADHHAA